jgi:hypothetical protein
MHLGTKHEVQLKPSYEIPFPWLQSIHILALSQFLQNSTLHLLQARLFIVSPLPYLHE